MSDETRMTLLHSSTNDLVEELLMWRGRAAELLDRIAELENEHAVWLVGATNEIDRLNARIAELEADNAEFRQLIRDWSIVLDQNNGFQLWHVESVRQAMLEINKEREE